MSVYTAPSLTYAKPLMNKTTPGIQNLSRRLIAIEADNCSPDKLASITARACDKLRGPIAKLVGVVGFHSLLSRALMMAKAEIPPQYVVQAKLDGTFNGLDGIDRIEDAAVGVVIVAKMLGLLNIFIGEPLMLLLVRDAWPDTVIDETILRDKGQS